MLNNTQFVRYKAAQASFVMEPYVFGNHVTPLSKLRMYDFEIIDLLST